MESRENVLTILKGVARDDWIEVVSRAASGAALGVGGQEVAVGAEDEAEFSRMFG